MMNDLDKALRMIEILESVLLKEDIVLIHSEYDNLRKELKIGSIHERKEQ